MAHLPGSSRRPPRLPPLRNLGLVALGGAVGGSARAAVGAAFPAAADAFPWSTFVANTSGAFLLAVLLTLAVERLSRRPWVLPLLGTGTLGAYTTFATVSLELERLLTRGSAALAVAYVAATLSAGLIAALAGMAAAHRLPRRAQAGAP